MSLTVWRSSRTEERSLSEMQAPLKATTIRSDYTDDEDLHNACVLMYRQWRMDEEHLYLNFYPNHGFILYGQRRIWGTAFTALMPTACIPVSGWWTAIP